MKLRRIILNVLGIVALACLFVSVFAAVRVASAPPPSAAELANRDATSVARQVATIDARHTAEAPTAAPIPTDPPTPVPTLAPADRPGSRRDALAAIAHDIYPRGLMSVEMTGITATIVFSTSSASDAREAVLLVAAVLRETAPRVFAETDAEWFVLDARGVFTTLTGQYVERSAFVFILSRAVNKSINWPNFNIGKLELVDVLAGDGSSVYVHSACRAAWDAYRASR